MPKPPQPVLELGWELSYQVLYLFVSRLSYVQWLPYLARAGLDPVNVTCDVGSVDENDGAIFVHVSAVGMQLRMIIIVNLLYMQISFFSFNRGQFLAPMLLCGSAPEARLFAVHEPASMGQRCSHCGARDRSSQEILQQLQREFSFQCAFREVEPNLYMLRNTFTKHAGEAILFGSPFPITRVGDHGWTTQKRRPAFY